MNTTSGSTFIRDAIEKRLQELRETCAVQREIKRHAFGRRWARGARSDAENDLDSGPSDKYWDDKQSEAQSKSTAAVFSADKVLAEFIAEHRSLMPSDWIGNDHGRLCWHKSTHGYPIGTHYCQKPEGHEGNHADVGGEWLRDEEVQRLETEHRADQNKRIANLIERTAEDWGNRNGPCVITYREFTTYQHPTYRTFSCHGCKHFRYNQEIKKCEDPKWIGTGEYCVHPQMLEKYEVPQGKGMAGKGDHKAHVNVPFCPALESLGISSYPERIPAARIPGKEPVYIVRTDDAFKPFNFQ